MTWGIVATIKAPVRDILDFAAYHLDLGAHRILIYLDEPHPEAEAALRDHPKLRITVCDDRYWQKRKRQRPDQHQNRQSLNATHAYRRAGDLDWLIHIDVDEFLWPQSSVADELAALPADTLCARVRPMEMLAGGDGTAFKAFIPPGPDRERAVTHLYPRFGKDIRGGFLSHIAGKVLVRTGLPDATYKIHNLIVGGETNPCEQELPELGLCHLHARDWDHWITAYRYRIARGSYRPGLGPVRPWQKDSPTLHDVLRDLEQRDGESGLRALFDEIAADTPALRGALRDLDLLRLCDLDLDARRSRLFPGNCL
jgi:hypothetical protein